MQLSFLRQGTAGPAAGAAGTGQSHSSSTEVGFVSPTGDLRGGFPKEALDLSYRVEGPSQGPAGPQKPAFREPVYGSWTDVKCVRSFDAGKREFWSFE